MKIILTDADGVLLNWEHGFHSWMGEHGHTPILNNSYNTASMYAHSAIKQGENIYSNFEKSCWMNP